MPARTPEVPRPSPRPSARAATRRDGEATQGPRHRPRPPLRRPSRPSRPADGHGRQVPTARPRGAPARPDSLEGGPERAGRLVKEPPGIPGPALIQGQDGGGAALVGGGALGVRLPDERAGALLPERRLGQQGEQQESRGRGRGAENARGRPGVRRDRRFVSRRVGRWLVGTIETSGVLRARSAVGVVLGARVRVPEDVPRGVELGRRPGPVAPVLRRLRRTALVRVVTPQQAVPDSPDLLC